MRPAAATETPIATAGGAGAAGLARRCVRQERDLGPARRGRAGLRVQHRPDAVEHEGRRFRPLLAGLLEEVEHQLVRARRNGAIALRRRPRPVHGVADDHGRRVGRLERN